VKFGSGLFASLGGNIS